jgi:hypothetical protein
MSAEDNGEYVFLFSIQPPVKLSDFILPSDMKVQFDKNLATSLEVTEYGNLEYAKSGATQRVKKLVALLSLRGIYTTAVFGSLYRVLPYGGKAYQVTIIESISFCDSILPNTITPILDVTQSLNINDVKFWRQMGHFYKGMSSKDPIERYREFFQVLEDDNLGTVTETALRHAVNHPNLTFPNTVSQVNVVLGNPFFDPMNQKHIDIIQRLQTTLK